LSTIAWATPAISAGGDRKLVGLERSVSGKKIFRVGLPIWNGTVSITSTIGGPAIGASTAPCATMVVPCGIEAMRTTVGDSKAFVVAGTEAQLSSRLAAGVDGRSGQRRMR
jgi:hypothetical protein